MFKCDHTELRLSFNEFHEVVSKDMPEYGEYCLLELKDGRHTAGQWYPRGDKKDTVSGEFGRGTADTVDVEEVAKWHPLRRYDLTSCLEDGEIKQINLGACEEGTYSVEFTDFKSLKDGDYPKQEQFCLLIMNDGSLAAGRWGRWLNGEGGRFIYASAAASHSMEKVWAWTCLSSDDIFAREEEREKERRIEEELNRNPSADPDRFRYGTDISVYYGKALEKLRREYPWATLTQMKKERPYVIVPRHGQYIFGQDNGTCMGREMIREWTDGSTAEEFIDFLCEYTKEAVRSYDPETKFKYGMDIRVYLEKAYENAKKEYHWLDKKMIGEYCQYTIKQVDGEWEFAKKYREDKDFFVYERASADSFIESIENDCQRAAIEANPVVAAYEVPFGKADAHGWNLEEYVFSKLSTGDYKVFVQAGDRVTGGSREFFITPYCFEARSYEVFLDRYLEIVPGNSFGLGKKDLLRDQKLKEFLGYRETGKKS